MDRSTINGVKVIEAGPTHFPIPGTNELRPTDTVEMCLLENEQIIYRCAELECDYTHENPVSVRSHRRAHGKAVELNRMRRELKITEAELAALKTKQEESRARRSAAALKVAAAKKAAKKSTSPADAESPLSRRELLQDAIEALLTSVEPRITDAIADLEHLYEEYRQLRDAVHELLDLGGDLTTEQREKLQRYDNLKAAGLVLP